MTLSGLSKSEIFDSSILSLKHEIMIFRWKGCFLSLGNECDRGHDSRPRCTVPGRSPMLTFQYLLYTSYTFILTNLGMSFPRNLVAYLVDLIL